MKAKTDTDKKSNFVLLDSIPEESESPIPDQSIDQNDLLFYAFKRHGKKTSHLVIKGALSEDIISYITDSSPEVYNMLEKWLEKDSLYIDLEKGKVWSTKRAVIHEEILALVEAIGTIDISPKRHISIPPSSDIASVILCGGKGSRMRSKDLHKVCFPIAGKLAASRLIDQLESAGISEHIVVVGEKGKQVIDEITDIHDGIAYVYQINQNGTGNAAKQAAYLLRSQGYEGTILVVPGDKVFEESALKRLCKTFKDSEADLALMTADKKFWPDAGRILFNRKGHPIDIVEKRDIQKMILSKKLLEIKRSNPGVSSKSLLREILNDVPDISRARIMFPGIIERLENNTNLSLADLEEMLPENRTSYAIRNGNEILNFSGDELEYATPVTNAAVYLFSADAFYKSVFSIRSDNAQKEEYLTDVVRILAEDTEKPWKIIPVPVKDQYEVMSYNNPEELLKIEEYYARKESISASVERSCERIHVTQRKHSLRPIEEWKRIIEEFGPDIRSSFREIYGDNEDIFTERRKVYLQALVKFTKVYGKNNSVIIARSPGRVNLMGRHVEHRGGFTNYMTINREAILVAGIREDDIVEIHNVDSRQFRPRRFSIGEELSRLPWDEWLNIIDSNTVLEMIRSTSGDWSNYFKAAALRLQEKFKGRLLLGFNGVLSSNIPLAAGLSSSSAVVVSAAEALTFINGLSFIPKDFVNLCGESEWFVGTRGGSGDHAAMKFGGKGEIIHMGFHDIRVEDIISFPEDYSLVILQSQQHAKKSEGAMQIFNEKVATYEVALAVVKSRYPEYCERLVYFRDINTKRLGLEPYEIYDILKNIPERITRNELMKKISKDDKERMEKIFSSHNKPSGGYEARRLTLFGISEIARAREFPGLIKKGNVKKAGRLMNISHDGDRVSKLDEKGERIRYENSTPDVYIDSLRDRLAGGDNSSSLYLQPGGYGCSTFIIDELVDTSLNVEGVAGAQLSGAGLGGCIMVLVKNESVDAFLTTMLTSFYEKHNIPENMLVCSPIAGSGILTLQ